MNKKDRSIQLICFAVVSQPWLADRCPPSYSITPPPHRTEGENMIEKFVGQDDEGEITSPLRSCAKQT